ncbi:MAG: hypothetical protein NC433_15780 [Clostridiales bacterium]|nr:hypothetical protein [Clostridiales bacterium]
MKMKNTGQGYVDEWLKEHNIILKEGFTASLARMAKEYKKKNGVRTLNEIYHKIGTSKECLYYWNMNPYGVQTKKIKV